MLIISYPQANRTATVVASDSQSRYNKVSSKYTQSKLQLQELEKQVNELRERNQELEAGTSSSKNSQDEIIKLRAENNKLKEDLEAATRKASHHEDSIRQLYSKSLLLSFILFHVVVTLSYCLGLCFAEVYNLSEEAIFLRTFPRKMDDNDLLAHLNDALSNYSIARINSLSLGDLKKELQELEIVYRSSMNYANRFQRNYRDSQLQVQLLKEEISKNKDKIESLKQKGAEALIEWQERVIAAKRELEVSVEENKDLRERDNKIRSRLLITSDDEFNWVATVIDRARNNLAVDASLHIQDSSLISDMIAEREGLYLFFFFPLLLMFLLFLI